MREGLWSGIFRQGALDVESDETVTMTAETVFQSCQPRPDVLQRAVAEAQVTCGLRVAGFRGRSLKLIAGAR